MVRKGSGRTSASGAAENDNTAASRDVAKETRKEEQKVSEVSQSGQAGPRLDQATGSRIGRKLKAMYDQVASEPVPDHLLELLSQLDEKKPEEG